MGQQRGVEKENKTLGTERCENIKNLYIKINKIIIIVIIIIIFVAVIIVLLLLIIIIIIIIIIIDKLV